MHSLPDTILGKINIDDYSKYDFIPFTNEKDIEYFKICEWIIDYGNVESLTLAEIRSLGEILTIKLETVTAILYQTKEGTSEYKKAITKYKILKHIISSIADISSFHFGLLNFSIPTKKIN